MKSFGLDVCKATIQHTPDSASQRMESERDRIADDMSDAKFLHLDDAGMPVCVANFFMFGMGSVAVEEQRVPY